MFPMFQSALYIFLNIFLQQKHWSSLDVMFAINNKL